MKKDRDTDGTFSQEHTDDEFVAAVRAHEPAATSEVANEVGMTRQGADRRLRRLRDEGRVNSKKIGASLVWFSVDAAGGGGGVRDEQEVREPEPEPEPAPESEPTSGDESDVSVSEDVRRAVDLAAERAGWEDDRRLDDRKAAACAVLEYAVTLRGGKGVSKSGAQERFLPAHSVAGQSDDTWWERNIKRDVLSKIGTYNIGIGYVITDEDVVAFLDEN